MRRREIIAIGGAALFLPTALVARQMLPEGKGGHVVVDPRIELMSVVHLLGGYFLLGEANTRYKTSANRYFAPYRDHPVVGMGKSLAKETLSFDAVPDLMLRLSEPDALAWRQNLPFVNPRGIPDVSQRQTFLSALRDFARVSRFRAFFDEHRPLYRQITQVISPMVVPNVEALEAYTGSTLGHWQVIAGLLLNDGGFGPRLTRKDDSLETYAVIGPAWNSVGEPDFRDNDRLQDLVVHEFAHSLINPLAEQHPDVVAQYADRFEPMRTAMKKVGDYNTWQIVVDEHVVRAVTARIAALRFGEPAGAKAVEREVYRGFTYVPALVEKLRVYEADRKHWPTLGTYYTKLLSAFE